MDNLISREAAIAYFFRPYSNEESYSNIDVEKALKDIPAVDAVPVVRCKDCWKNNTEACPRVWSEGDPLTGENCVSKFYEPKDEDNWFCADGERREE